MSGEMRLKPSNIFYSQDSINNKFGRHCRHEYIGDTLDDLLEGRIGVHDIPTINVFKQDDKWFSNDNRRLWVFHHLEGAGKCSEIPVRVGCRKDRFTTWNGGTSVIVRRSPGGRLWRTIRPVTPKPYLTPLMALRKKMIERLRSIQRGDALPVVKIHERKHSNLIRQHLRKHDLDEASTQRRIMHRSHCLNALQPGIQKNKRRFSKSVVFLNISNSYSSMHVDLHYLKLTGKSVKSVGNIRKLQFTRPKKTNRIGREKDVIKLDDLTKLEHPNANHVSLVTMEAENDDDVMACADVLGNEVTKQESPIYGTNDTDLSSHNMAVHQIAVIEEDEICKTDYESPMTTDNNKDDLDGHFKNDNVQENKDSISIPDAESNGAIGIEMSSSRFIVKRDSVNNLIDGSDTTIDMIVEKCDDEKEGKDGQNAGEEDKADDNDRQQEHIEPCDTGPLVKTIDQCNDILAGFMERSRRKDKKL